MNDHHSHRRGAGSPAWPSGDDPDSPANGAEPQERTGFWSPLWDDDQPSSGPHVGGRTNGRGGAHHVRPATNGTNGSNGSAGRRAAHRLPDDDPRAERANGAHHAAPPPRSARPSGGPAWPTEEPPPPPQRPNGARPSGASANGAPANGAPAWPNGAQPGGARPQPGQSTRVVHPRPAGPPRPGGPGRTGPGGPGIPDGPTEHLRPVHGFSNPEPELLTHRELDYDDDQYEEEAYEPQDPYAGPDVPLSESQRRRRRKKIWRRVRRAGYVATAFMIIGPMVAFFVAYQIVDVPSPESVRQDQAQTVTLQFANRSLMGKVVPEGGENRTLIHYEDIPKDVLHAVFAAEDADFMTNPGFDIAGVLRAGWNQVTGGEGGGSTITQQYVKKATGNEQKTLTRKALEVVTAYKMNNTYPKEEIITAYLNTVYFGRSAYGVSAAAQAYFNKPLKKITAEEAALLAGMIQNPSRYKDDEYQQRRWNYVMDQMVAHNWYPADKRASAEFPQQAPLEKARPGAMTGPSAHIKNAVIRELEERAGISENELYEKGYTIRTTIDRRAQTAAVKAVNQVMGGQPKTFKPALVAVNPKNGAVLAYYGGSNGIGLDWAAAKQEPGSAFKPFDLVALLERGEGLAKRYDGTSGRMFKGRDTPVRNSGDASCGKQCTVAEAMKRSINTVFYDLAVNTVGTNAVWRAAKQAGIRSDLNGKAEDDKAPNGNISIGGGDTLVSTFEMASAYATFAADGMYRTPHLVSQVLWPDGTIKWQATDDEKPAFDENDSSKNHQIARNVTESLKPVIEYSNLKCPGEQVCAGKTGTHQFVGKGEENAKAWMVGYTPQVSAAVSLGAQSPQGKQIPLRNRDGAIVYGSGLPGQIWQEFMERYLANVEPEDFGEFEAIGEDFREIDQTDEDDRDDDRDDDRGRGRGDDDGRGRGDDDGRGNGGGNGGGDETGTDVPQPSIPEPPDTGEPEPSGPVFPPIGG